MRRRGSGFDVRSNLLLRWRLMDTSGDALDSSGNDYDGTVTGATQSSTGVTLDGVNDEITNINAALLTALSGLTVFTVFLRASASAYVGLDAAFSFGVSAGNDVWAIYPYDTQAGNGCSVWSDGAYTFTGGGTAPADGTNNDFCFVSRSATDKELFVNGVSVATSATSKTTAAAVTALSLGRYAGNGEWYAGGVDELAVWTRDLTDEQIKSLSDR